MDCTAVSQVVDSLPRTKNRLTSDPALLTLLDIYLSKEAYKWAFPVLNAMGEESAGRLDELAYLADRNPPQWYPCDRFGNRIDHLEFHPAYRKMQKIAYGQGIISHYYNPKIRQLLGDSLEVVKFAQGYLFSQAEQGLYCPICMTDGTAYLIEKYGNNQQKKELLPHLTASEVDQLWEGSMFLTEREGGSDVGANTTEASPINETTYALAGEKWFCSNAGAEVSMVLARPKGAPGGTRGLGLFAMKRHTGDGSLNKLRIVRLKDKLGTRSMPTAEIVLEGAEAQVVGDISRGFLEMTDMLNLSRLYNATASLGVCRRVLTESLRWCAVRHTFGRKLTSYPMLRSQLVDMTVELEASLHLLLETAYRRGKVLQKTADEQDERFLRLMTPILKYTTGRQAVDAASQAIEIHGGNGYIEDWPLARMFRDAQVLPIWEGTTNILILDAYRAMRKQQCHHSLFEWLNNNAPSELKQYIKQLHDKADEFLRDPTVPYTGRWTDLLAKLTKATLLCQHSGSQRASKIAELYLLRHFLSEPHVLTPSYMEMQHRCFEEIADQIY